MTGFEPHTIESNGLRLQLATRRLAGPLVPGRPPRRWFWLVMRIPAWVLIGFLLIAPTVWTVGNAFAVQPRMVIGSASAALSAVALVVLTRHRDSTFTTPRILRRLGWVAAIGGVGVGLYLIATQLDTGGALAYGRTVILILFGELMVLGALIFAWWGKNSRWLWWPLIIPFGISTFVSGIAFRLIFEWMADQNPLGSVLQYQFWFVLMLLSAFVWTWLGVLIYLCRAAILGLDADPVRTAELYDSDDREPKLSIALIKALLRLLRPPLLLLGLVVGIAAARVFDVVLIAVPSTMQVSVDSATVHWWNMATTSGFGSGEVSAYALPLAVLIGVVAWALQPDMRRYRRHWTEERTPRTDSGRNRVLPRVLLAVITVFTLIPVGVLIFVALRPGSAFGGDALRWARGDDALWRSLRTTVWVAGLATIIVVGAAAPIAYRLAALATDGLKSRFTVPTLVVLTVMPAQLYAGPIRVFMDNVGLSGTRIPLILVHAAAGLPMAILILRGALLAPPDSPAADALHGLTSRETTLRRFGGVAAPALGAVVVLEFTQVWNDFFIGLLISGAGGSPWSLLLWGEARQFHENAAHLAVGALLSAVVPVGLLLVLAWRGLVPGLTGGFAR